MRRQTTALVALALVSLVGVGHGAPNVQPQPAPPADPKAPERLAAALRAPFGPGHVAAGIEALARAGVATGANTDLHVMQQVAGPPSIYRYFEAQVRSMAFEVAAGGGWTGAALNTLVPPVPAAEVPGGQIPFSAILAAYAAQADTFGARLSRALLGPIDPTAHASLTYPRLVVALFLADVGPREPAGAAIVLLDRVASLHAFRSAPLHTWTSVTADACVTVNEFTRSLGERVHNLLSPEGEGLLATVGRGIATAIGAATTIVVNIFRRAVLDNPVLKAVRSALAVAAVMTQAASLLNPWHVRVAAAPTHYGVGSRGEGRFVATVVADRGWTWPQPIRSCADLLDIELPQLTDPSEADIVWSPGEGFGVHAIGGPETDGLLLSGGNAYVDDYDYETNTESPKAHEKGKSATGYAAMSVRVARPEIDRIKDFVFKVLSLPSLATLVADPATGWLRDVTDPTVAATARIAFHLAPDEEEEEEEGEEENKKEEDDVWGGTIVVRTETVQTFGASGDRRTTLEVTYTLTGGGQASSRGLYEERWTTRGDACPTTQNMQSRAEWSSARAQVTVTREFDEPGFVYEVAARLAPPGVVPTLVRNWATPCPCDPDERRPCQLEQTIETDPPAAVLFTVERRENAAVMEGRITRPVGTPMAGLPMQISGTEVITYSFRRVPRP